MQQYRLLSSKGNEWLPNIRDVGFQKYSQFEEDGILLYIFSLIGPIDRTFVEICAGALCECMIRLAFFPWSASRPQLMRGVARRRKVVES